MNFSESNVSQFTVATNCFAESLCLFKPSLSSYTIVVVVVAYEIFVNSRKYRLWTGLLIVTCSTHHLGANNGNLWPWTNASHLVHASRDHHIAWLPSPLTHIAVFLALSQHSPVCLVARAIEAAVVEAR